MSKLENGEYELNDIINNENTSNSKFILGQYEGKEVILRKGKFGLYVTWGDNSRNLKELGNRPIENITFQEVKEILEKNLKRFLSLMYLSFNSVAMFFLHPILAEVVINFKVKR